MADDLGERFDELATSVLAPLVLGGTLQLVRPIGAKLALVLGRGRTMADADLRSRIDLVRVRRARAVAPIDALPDLDVNDWALVAAYADLLQVTNHELGSRLTRGRWSTLLGSVRATAERVPPPRSLRVVLSRHASFARALDAVRTDAQVSWWTGKASFRGEPPSPRLLAWPELRRVRVEKNRVRLEEMCIGIDAVTTEAFLEVLALWLSRTPLTDVAHAARREPAFAWTPPTLSLVASAPGRAVAVRALAREPTDLVLAALGRATEALADPDARSIAGAFVAELQESAKLRPARAGT